jgi:hypothetical protein
MAYYAGHFTHAIADRLVAWFNKDRWRILMKEDSLPKDIRNAALQKILRDLKLTSSKQEIISPHWLFRIADEVIGQCGQTGDREIFMTRVGFYRGSLVALVVLCLSLFIRALIPVTYIMTTGESFQIPSLAFTFTLVLLIIGIIFLYYRYRKFVDYRVTNAIICFLVLKQRQ